MRKIDVLLNKYAESHQTKFNKAIHYICVPAIFFSLMGFLSLVSFKNLFTGILPEYLLSYANLATLVIFIGLFYYLKLSKSLFLGMLLFCILVMFGIGLLKTVTFIPFWGLMLGIFVIAWIFQFVGHNHEGKKPNFLEDIQFLMIGPAWTISHIFDALKLKY